MKTLLFAWIGNNDISCSSQYKSGNSHKGAIAQALGDKLNVDDVILLTNYTSEKRKHYEVWLRQQFPTINIVLKYTEECPNPTDYNAVFKHCDQTIRDMLEQQKGECNLIYHLSPGTPTMHAIWMLLSRTIYPGRLIQTTIEGKVEWVKIPFEISAEYVPPLFKKSDGEIIRLSQPLPPDAPGFDEIIYRSQEMLDVVQMAYRLAPRNIPVLIEGESGTGKELIARAIHKSSKRSKNKLVAINCGALPENIVESELFGHKKGAFTGANSDRRGRILESSKGTLFLDEIGELSLDLQVKFLRVLQEKTVLPLGANHEEDVDLRIIAATNRNLPKEVSGGRFREDLFYRLAAGYIHVPPIRERAGDLGLLVDHFLNKINNEENNNDPGYKHKNFSPAAKNILLNHSWPGNVRELEFTIQRAALLWASGDTIEVDDIKKAILPINYKGDMGILNRKMDDQFEINKLLEEIERHYIVRALNEGGNLKTASKLLGYKNDNQTLNGRLKKHNISLEDKLAR